MSFSHTDICQFFKERSNYVWNRIGFARKMSIRISETTITEELLYGFYKAYWDSSIPIRVFESIEEHKNGCDVEILVKTKRGFILLACQAKITYKSGKYKSFYHKVKEIPQIDLLRKYAKVNGGIAQYLLYNYLPDWKMNKEALKLSNHENYGITQVSADQIYDWMKAIEGEKPKVPSFNEFHPEFAYPLHELICALLKDDEPFGDFFPTTLMDEMRYYSENDVTNAEKWNEVTTGARIGYVEPNMILDDEKLDEYDEKENQVPVFSPKFRLVVGGEVSKGGLYELN